MTDEQLSKSIAKAQTVADRQALNLSTLLHAIEQGKSILEGKEPRASRVWVENALRFPSVAFHECHDFSNASEQFSFGGPLPEGKYACEREGSKERVVPLPPGTRSDPVSILEHLARQYAAEMDTTIDEESFRRSRFTHVLSDPIPGQLWITWNGRKLLRTDNLPKPIRLALALIMRRVGR